MLPVSLRNPDKLNRIDFHWFILRSLPHQEKKLAGLLREHQADIPNLLEAYCPLHTTVRMSRGGEEPRVPLFAGYVFVLGTRQAVAEFLARYYPEGVLLYGQAGGKPVPLTVPEPQMRSFKDFNENYADKVVILERPYSDYAFNPKTGEPNEIVKVLDGPLAGREGYLARFRRDKCLVFNMKIPGTGRYYAVSVPRIWDFHVVRLHNTEGDRQSLGTRKGRAADLLIGLLQGGGYGAQALPMLHELVSVLSMKPSLVELCKLLRLQGHGPLAHQLSQISTSDAGLLLELARYERENPGYVESHWKELVIRPFLTPTSGIELAEGRQEAELPHEGFTETIRRVDITEAAYSPGKGCGEQLVTTYYAHVGMLPDKDDTRFTLFANWDAFLCEYFLTAGKANEQLVAGTAKGMPDPAGKVIESFRNYAPTLYKVLTDADSAIKAVPCFKVGDKALNVLAVTASAPDLERAKDELIKTGIAICQEINAGTHLAVWRRYLRGVWLHQ